MVDEVGRSSTPGPGESFQLAMRMHHNGPTDLPEQCPIAPIIRVGRRFVHRDLPNLGPSPGPVQFPLAVTWRAFSDSDESAALDSDRGRDRVRASQVLREGFEHDPGGRRDQDDRRAFRLQILKVLDNPLVEPGPDIFGEVVPGDPLEVDDGDPRDAVEPEADQSTVVEPSESMLEPVVERPEDERSLDEALSPQDPGEQVGRRLGQERAVDVDERQTGRGLVAGPGAHDFLPWPTRRPSSSAKARAVGASAASAMTRTIARYCSTGREPSDPASRAGARLDGRS